MIDELFTNNIVLFTVNFDASCWSLQYEMKLRLLINHLLLSTVLMMFKAELSFDPPWITSNVIV